MNRQQDAVGLCLFDEQVRQIIPHRSVRRQMFQVLPRWNPPRRVPRPPSLRHSTKWRSACAAAASSC